MRQRVESRHRNDLTFLDCSALLHKMRVSMSLSQACHEDSVPYFKTVLHHPHLRVISIRRGPGLLACSPRQERKVKPSQSCMSQCFLRNTLPRARNDLRAWVGLGLQVKTSGLCG